MVSAVFLCSDCHPLFPCKYTVWFSATQTWRQTWPTHDNLRLLTVDSKSSWRSVIVNTFSRLRLTGSSDVISGLTTGKAGLDVHVQFWWFCSVLEVCDSMDNNAKKDRRSSVLIHLAFRLITNCGGDNWKLERWPSMMKMRYVVL